MFENICMYEKNQKQAHHPAINNVRRKKCNKVIDTFAEQDGRVTLV